MNFSDKVFTTVPCDTVLPGIVFYYSFNFYRMRKILKNHIQVIDLNSGETIKLQRWFYLETEISKRRNSFIYSGTYETEARSVTVKIISAEILIKALQTDSEFQEKLKNFGLNINNILINLGEQP